MYVCSIIYDIHQCANRLISSKKSTYFFLFKWQDWRVTHELHTSPSIRTRAWNAVGVAHNGSGPRGASRRWVSVCGRWGRDDGHLCRTDRVRTWNSSPSFCGRLVCNKWFSNYLNSLIQHFHHVIALKCWFFSAIESQWSRYNVTLLGWSPTSSLLLCSMTQISGWMSDLLFSLKRR